MTFELNYFRGTFQYLAFAILLAALLGSAVSAFSDNVFVIGAVLAVCLLPLLLVAVNKSSRIAIVLIFAAQPLEGYDIPTFAGNISFGNMLILLVFLVWYRELALVLKDKRIQPWFFLIVLYVVSHFLQLTSYPLQSVLRSLVTLASYATFWLLGAWIGYRGYIRHAALASTAAVLMMGVLGLGVAIGLIPETTRINSPRTLFGIESPFVRSYGTELPFDATAFLVALALPALVVPLLSKQRSLANKLTNLAALSVMIGFFFLTFQSRNLILQVLISLAIAAFLRVNIFGRIIVVGAASFVALRWIWPSIYGEGYVQTSSEIRLFGLELAFDILRGSSEWWLGGIHQSRVLELLVERHPRLQRFDYSTSFQPIHNFVLNEFVGAGLLVGVLLCSILIGCALLLVQLHLRSRDGGMRFYSDYLINAYGLAFMVTLVEPVSSNVLGLWALFGMIVGRYSILLANSDVLQGAANTDQVSFASSEVTSNHGSRSTAKVL